MDHLLFYQDTPIGKEIAFVLGIPYEYTDSCEKVKGKILFVQNLEDFEDSDLIRGEDYISFDELYDYFDQFVRDSETYSREWPPCRNLDDINQLPIEQLYLSEMLIKVLFSKPKDIDCYELTTNYNLDCNGDLWGCCPGWILKPFGNYLYDENVVDNYFARVIKLSEINKTFCFCDLSKCKYYGKEEVESVDLNFDIPKYPRQLIVSIDKTCNLRCNSCRTCFYVPTEEEKNKTRELTDKLLASDILNHTDVLMAGQGEVFYSEHYDKILRNLKKTDIITILSNGTLFNEEKWNLIYPKFKTIIVAISIDAYNKDTYIKLRHGDYDALIKNLDMLGKLRKEGKLNVLNFNFVVQKENYQEMIDFVKFAEKHHVDHLFFTKLNNWGTMTDEEYHDKSLIIDNYLDYDLYQILQDPIFQKKFVDIGFFKEYLIHSREHYGK